MTSGKGKDLVLGSSVGRHFLGSLLHCDKGFIEGDPSFYALDAALCDWRCPSFFLSISAGQNLPQTVCLQGLDPYRYISHLRRLRAWSPPDLWTRLYLSHQYRMDRCDQPHPDRG